MTDEEAAAARDVLERLPALWAQVQEAWRCEMQPILQEVGRFLSRNAQAQGILSPAYAYATPTMRRRAARERAHLAMQAKNRHKQPTAPSTRYNL